MNWIKLGWLLIILVVSLAVLWVVRQINSEVIKVKNTFDDGAFVTSVTQYPIKKIRENVQYEIQTIKKNPKDSIVVEIKGGKVHVRSNGMDNVLVCDAHGNDTYFVFGDSSVTVLKKRFGFRHKVKIGIDNKFYAKKNGYELFNVSYSPVFYKQIDVSLLAGYKKFGIGMERKMYRNFYGGSFIVVEKGNLGVYFTFAVQVY